MLVLVVHIGINFKILYLYNDDYCLNIMIIATIMKVMPQNQIMSFRGVMHFLEVLIILL